ncbi:MAG TPA: hypothetical protein VNN55_11945 [bacterium]|nr:hypothetical protein [bacterium]
MRTVLLTVGVMIMLGTAMPSTSIGQVISDQPLQQEIMWSDFFGSDARSMGMGNTGLALGHDGSALIYNPANLASIKRVELRAGLSHLRLGNETWLSAVNGEEYTEDRDISKTRLNALSVAVPVPTYRGSLVFAFGLHRVNSFDRTFGVQVDTIGGEDTAFRGREIETGGMWKWSAGGAVDISPRVSLGASLHLLTGKDEYNWESRDANDPVVIVSENQSIDIEYIGISATGGISFNLSPAISAGLTVETPTLLDAEENSLDEIELDTLSSNFIWYDVTRYYQAYTFTKPFVFGFGFAGSFGSANLAADMRYTDWTQTDVSFDNPTGDPEVDADENAALSFIQDELTDVLSIQLGAEYLFPENGLTLRAGYFRDPLPVDEKYIEKQRQYFTAGVGFLIDRVMTLDLAYVHGGYELRNDDPGTYNTEYKTRRVFATFGYRI